MLSPGTRIGPHRVGSWIREGAGGQSYKGERTEGEKKRELFYLKLLPREISEKRGFEELFTQECQALEQVEGPGIWPLRKFGVMKWKHWLAYDWHSGKVVEIEESSGAADNPEAKEMKCAQIYSLEDDLKFDPVPWRKEDLLSLMITLHRALYQAHGNGFTHGNLKPENILISREDGKKLEAWITEFGLYRLVTMSVQAKSEEGEKEKMATTLEAQASQSRSAEFRPQKQAWGESPEEAWDLHALGKVAVEILPRMAAGQDLSDWEDWSAQATGEQPFESVAHSMDAVPKVGDITRYGVKLEDGHEISDKEIERIRKQREQEWLFAEKTSSLRFKRNMTGLVGGLFLLIYLIKTVYLYFSPAPWTEYSLAGVLDSYQLAAGVWSGQAWGILPGAYDDEGNGGQNVVGTWEKEDGMFKMDFRKFKKPEDNGESKKLWQFIGKGATSPDDYYIWSDYLTYDRSRDALLLRKRTDGDTTYKPGKEGGRDPQLYPERRFIDRESDVKEAELVFARTENSGLSWELFLGLGFLLSCSMYFRNLNKLILAGPASF